MRIADDVGNTRQCSKFFRSALGITASYDDADGRVGGVEFPDGIPRLGIGSGSYSAGVQHDDVGRFRGRCERTTAFAKLSLDRSAISLGGATAKLLHKKGSHRSPVYRVGDNFVSLA